MPKVLIAVMTCARYLDRRNAVRDTWIPFVERLNPDVVVRFFSGSDPCLVDDSVGDIVHLDCPDTYKELPQKTYKLVEYAVGNEFITLIKVDDDTYFLPLPEYIAEMVKYENLGSVRQNPQHNDFVPYAQGGCYSLGMKAMDAVLSSPEHPTTNKKVLFQTGIEDGAVGKALKLAGIVPQHTERIKTDYRHGAPCMGNDIISAHSCQPEHLRQIHERNQLTLLARYSQVLAAMPQGGEIPADTPLDIHRCTFPNDIRQTQEITICVTSCGRHDLLKRTVDSLAATNLDYPIKETIVYEDSDARKPEWIDSGDNPLRGLGKIRWVSNGKREGQWISIDRMYDLVQTEYIFHCEDDWEFDGRPFLAESVEILKQWRNIIQVSLRGDDNTSGHPNVNSPDYYTGEFKDAEVYTDFKIQQPYWRQHWGGFSGNPGLRRKSDWQRIGSYGRATGYGQGGIAPEQIISKLYLDLGYRIAVLPTDKPFVKHIGERRSKAVDKLPPKPKVLIAIAACHKYEYGAHTSGINRVTEGRIQAQRDTWIKDIAPFASYVDYRFFYGRSPNGIKPKPDEVFLPVADDYTSLPDKMKAIYKWALGHGYAYVYKADDDTLINVALLMRDPYDQFDQLGFSNCTHGLNSRKCSCYITGGAGYWLSKKAMLACVSARPLPPNNPHRWAEDYTTGMALRDAFNIRREGSKKYLPGFAAHYVSFPLPEGTVAAHAVTPEDMRSWYAGE
jgi:hypothetical protein